MPTKATVYRALIASPTDVEEERRATKDVIMQWNAAHSRQTGVYIEPVLYETHVAKDLGDSPQNIINDQLIDHCDFAIGIFWNRIGTETNSEPGGAVEEVKTLAFEHDKPAIVGFSERDVPMSQLDIDQVQAVQAFKEECRERGLYFTYETMEEFKIQLSQDLANTMNRLSAESSEEGFTKKPTEDAEASEYDPEVDHERLKLSSEMHRDQDVENLEDVVAHFEDVGIDPPYRVLDAGCGYGTVTRSRFGDDDRFEVLAIDVVPNVLEIAESEYDADNIDYRRLDANDLADADIGRFDLVFSTYLFHHLENQEAVLSYLWERVDEDGALLVRSCDDGQHLHYPPDEDMDWVVDVTDDIKGSSDRTHGRRLYTHLKRLQPEPERIDLDLRNYHTADEDRRGRREYWEVFHSNRLHYAEVLANRRDATDHDEAFFERMRSRFERLEQKFIDNAAFLDTKSVPLTVAYK